MRARSRTTLIAAGLLALGGVAWWLLASGGTTETGLSGRALPHADRVPGVAPVFAAEPGADDAASSATLPAADAASAAPAAALAVLAGRVSRADGSPVAGVAVSTWVQRDGRGVRAPLAASGEPVTGADGRYRLDFTQACTVVRLLVACGPDTTSARRDVSLELETGRTATLDVQVGDGAAISGLVVDNASRPVAGAKVYGWSSSLNALRQEFREADRTALSDASGGFVLAGLGPDFLLTADAPGFVCLRSLGGTVPEGAHLGLAAGGAPLEPPLTLVLSPAREIRGRVLGPGDEPVAHAYVVAAPVKDPERLDATAVPDVFAHDPWQLERRSGEDGSFVLSPAASVPYEIAVTAPDTPGWTGRHAPGDPDLVVHLGSGAELGGLVTSATDGAPVPNAKVRIDAEHDGFTSTTNAWTDAQGRFLLKGLRATHRAELALTAPGHALAVLCPVAIAASDNADLHVALDPERVLAGRVVDKAGAPVAGAIVTLAGDRVGCLGAPGTGNETWESIADLDRTQADAEGRFRLDQLYAGNFELTAWHPQRKELRATASAASGREDVVLVLDPDATAGVTVAGHATDASTGRPVTSFEVAALSPAQGSYVGESHAFDDGGGAYRITGLPPGSLLIHAQASGYATWTEPLEAPQPGEQRVDIQFVPMRAVRLRVVDAGGAPLVCLLTFRDAQGHALMVSATAAEARSLIRTDATGEVQVQGLPADRVMVTARTETGRSQDFPLDLRPEPHGTIVLRFEVPMTLHVHVAVVGTAANAPPDGVTLAGQLAANAAWPVESDVEVRVVGADGAVLAQAPIGGAPSAADLAATRQLVPGAARSIFADFDVPRNTVASVVAQAAGYVTATQPLPAPAEGADTVDVLVLMRRK